MSRKTKDILIVGFALFAIFFGAGNIIFPPQIGVMAGDRWWHTMIGFLTADPLIPVFGVIVTSTVGGSASALGRRVGRRFTDILFGTCILIMGPLFAIPRTAATTHEISIMHNFDSIPPYVTSFIFLGITMLLTLKKSGVVDKIGKYLTPGLLLILSIIIIKSIVSPAGTMIKTSQSHLFLNGFKVGYQTMDALGAALMTGIVVQDLRRRGYKKQKDLMNVVWGVGVVVIILLAFVYGGLTYVGATTGNMFSPDEPMISILIGSIHAILGQFGVTIIAIGVGLACLTTSVGLSAIVANFFQEVSNGKMKYKHTVIGTAVISFFISLVGVEKIVALAVPVLSAIYPVMIALLLLNAFNKYIKHDYFYIGAVVGTLLVSIPTSLNIAFGIWGGLANFINTLPLHNLGFEWLLPTTIFAVLFNIIAVIFKIENKKHPELQLE